MSSLVVQVTPAKKETIPITPNSTLFQVLSEACKRASLDPDQFYLVVNNKEVDLSRTFRLSGLVNNQKLDLKRRTKSASDASVSVVVQRSDGRRVAGAFSPATTLEEVLRRSEVDVSGPASLSVVLMNREVATTSTAGSITLSSLGLRDGSALFRVVAPVWNDAASRTAASRSPQPVSPSPSAARPDQGAEPAAAPPSAALAEGQTESSAAAVPMDTSAPGASAAPILAEPATAAADSAALPVVEPPAASPAAVPPATAPTPADVISDRVPTPTPPTPAEAPSLAAAQPAVADVSAAEAPSPQPATAVPARPSAAARPSSETQSMEVDADASPAEAADEILSDPDTLEALSDPRRGLRVFHAAGGDSSLYDVPDDFYDITERDLTHILPPRPDDVVRSRRAPASSAAPAARTHSAAVIRVRLAARGQPEIYLQGAFRAREPAAALFDWLRPMLAQPDRPFVLYSTPPPCRVDPDASFEDQRLCPSSLVHFRWLDGSSPAAGAQADEQPLLRPELLSSAELHPARAPPPAPAAASAGPASSSSADSASANAAAAAELRKRSEKPTGPDAAGKPVPKWFKGAKK